MSRQIGTEVVVRLSDRIAEVSRGHSSSEHSGRRPERIRVASKSCTL